MKIFIMQHVLTLIMIIVYVIIGSQLQKFEIITHPAYWTIFGATFGFVVSEIWRWK